MARKGEGKKEDQDGKKEGKILTKNLAIGIVSIIIVIAVGVSFLPYPVAVKVKHMKEVPHKEKWVGYTECVSETCTFYKRVCTERGWFGGCQNYEQVCKAKECNIYAHHCKLKVKNVGDKEGEFSFDAYIVKSDGNRDHYGKKSKYIQPDEVKTFEWVGRYPEGKFDHCDIKNYEVPEEETIESEMKSVPIHKILLNQVDWYRVERS